MPSVKDLINSIKELDKYMVISPEREREIYQCLGTFLLMKGYKVLYEGKPVDFIVKVGDTEIPIEVKLNPTVGGMEDAINNLFEDMKENNWDKGILLVVDTKSEHKAFTEAEKKGVVEKYKKKIYVVGVKI